MPLPPSLRRTRRRLRWPRLGRDVSPAVRNIGIILLLALAVFALPGGGTGAAIVEALLGILFGVGIWLFLMRTYREHRSTIFGLGDKYRGILYASLLGLLFCGASYGRWTDYTVWTFVWIAMLAACVWGLVATFRHYREYV